MTPGARLAAAIEIMEDVAARHRPVADALKDYGLSHRFAGSKDRSAIAALVYDALRRRSSAAWIADDASPRAVLLGSLRLAHGLDVEAIAALCTGLNHCPAPLTDVEREALSSRTLEGAPPPIAGDFPDWLAPSLAQVFGDDLVAEMQALAQRAPLDLRVNRLKGDRIKALAALAHLDPAPSPLAPDGIRLTPGADGRGPSLAGEPAYAKGLVEIQDEGSQLAVALAGARPGDQVLDFCAGAGGKTLALAALMDNRGQIYATDVDAARLAGLYPRLDRSGARNVQIRAPKRRQKPLDDLVGRCDLVLIDAPCTGTGTWRRNPDAKWRTRPSALDLRIAEQDAVLEEARPFVKTGGRLVYITCSVLEEENEGRLRAFLVRNSDFASIPPAELAAAAGLAPLAVWADPFGLGLRLTPRRTGTDGFYIAGLQRG